MATISPRTVLVLGGGSDIGAACVAALAGHGTRDVVLAARRPDEAVRTVTDTLGIDPQLDGERDGPTTAGPRVHGLEWDALDTAATGPLLDRVVERWGLPDVVIVAVGRLGHHAGLGLGPDEVDTMVRTNFAGPAAALSCLADRLADGSGTERAVVVLSSVAGVRTRRSNFVYGSSKAGIDAFALGLGDALAGSGVRVLVVRPGFVRSSMTHGLDPAPFATDPDTVGRSVSRAVLGGRSGVVSVPGVLGPLFAVLRVLPRPLWRRIAGDR